MISPFPLISVTQQVPDDVMECVVIIQKHLFQSVQLKDPTICAYAFQYFIKTVKTCSIDPINIVIRAIAALHLASKVCEEAKLLSRIVYALEDCKLKENLISYFNRLGIYQQILDMDPQVLIEYAKIAELDIIQELEFDFFIELPYNYIKDFTNTVIHWHLNKENEYFAKLTDETYKTSLIFLNDLQMSYVFYKFPPKVIAQTALRLSFHLLHLILPDFHNTRWYSLLTPEFPIPLLDQCTDLSYNYFVKRGLDFATRKKQMFPKNLLMEWNALPIVQPTASEPLCPPPPLNLLINFTSLHDEFSCIWSDHVPTVPPPLHSELEESYRAFSQNETKSYRSPSVKITKITKCGIQHKRITLCPQNPEKISKISPTILLGNNQDLLNKDQEHIQVHNDKGQIPKTNYSSEVSTPTEFTDFLQNHR